VREKVAAAKPSCSRCCERCVRSPFPKYGIIRGMERQRRMDFAEAHGWLWHWVLKEG